MNKEMARLILIFVIGCYHVSLSNQYPLDGEMIWRVNPFWNSKPIGNQFDTNLYSNEVSILLYTYHRMNATMHFKIVMNIGQPNLVFRLCILRF